MRIAALPIPFHRAAGNRPPELSRPAADRPKLLARRRAICADEYRRLTRRGAAW